MKDINIVGGGLVGSLLAAYMSNKGHKVQVFERRPDMRKQTISAGRSINMACSTRGWKALDKVGVGDLVRKEAIAMKGRMMHDVEGNLTFQPYGKEDEAIYSISRGGLNQILMSFAESKGATFSFNHQCTGVDLPSGAATFYDTEQKKNVEANGDVLFGTDGAFSQVRNVMQKLDRFNYSQSYITHSYKELLIPAGQNGNFLMEKNALHIWPRGQFMLIALPNPDGSFTCTLFLPQEGENSFDELTTDDAVIRFFEKEFPDAMELMPNLTEVFFSNPTSSLAIIRCFPWSYHDKVCLLGDASHAIVPFYGQGMISGFEDCDVLDDIINQNGDDWNHVFKQFEKARKPNADAIADLAMRNFVEMRDLVGDATFLLRKKLEKRIHELHPGKFLPLYSMVTFSHIPYAEAKSRGEQQDVMLDEIMNAVPDLENKLDSEEVAGIIEEKLKLL